MRLITGYRGKNQLKLGHLVDGQRKAKASNCAPTAEVPLILYNR
ncbi:hypothetical protein [Pantoea sp. S18]